MGNVYVTSYGLKVKTDIRTHACTRVELTETDLVLSICLSMTVISVQYSLTSNTFLCLCVFQIWRVNTKYNVLYVNGTVPGHRNCLLKVK